MEASAGQVVQDEVGVGSIGVRVAAALVLVGPLQVSVGARLGVAKPRLAEAIVARAKQNTTAIEHPQTTQQNHNTPAVMGEETV